MQKLTIKVLDKELEFDVYDIESARRFQEGISEVQRICKIGFADSRLDNIIEQQCKCVFKFFDIVVGEGTSEFLFGDIVNLRIVVMAYKEFNAGVVAQKDAIGEWLA